MYDSNHTQITIPPSDFTTPAMPNIQITVRLPGVLPPLLLLSLVLLLCCCSRCNVQGSILK
jgi:hypothetical protein